MSARRHLVVGAGPAGTALAVRLAERGERVRLVSRSPGTRPHPGVEQVAVDATDPAALSAAGADVIYNCANPGPYPAWETGWPPLATAILIAAERSESVLVTLSNLYGYGPVDGPMTRATPLRPSDHKGALRNRMWRQALAAHRAGRVRVTEARASDYIGPTAPVANGLLPRYASRTLVGRPAWVLADPDQPHSWTAVDDIAATLAVLGREERAWGHAWLVPSNPPVTVRTVLTDLGRRVGAAEPRLRRVPRGALRAGAGLIPMLREVAGVLYQFDRPFVLDASETSAVFGVTASPWDPLLTTTARAWWRRAASGPSAAD